MVRCLFRLLVGTSLSVWGTADAEVYRCSSGGSVVYTDRPCEAYAEPAELAPIGRVPAQDRQDLEQAFDARRARRLKSRSEHDQRWLETHQARQARADRVRQAQFNKQVIQGMNEDEVRGAIGSPDEIRRSGARQTWIYHQQKHKLALGFESGFLHSIKGARALPER